MVNAERGRTEALYSPSDLILKGEVKEEEKRVKTSRAGTGAPRAHEDAGVLTGVRRTGGYSSTGWSWREVTLRPLTRSKLEKHEAELAKGFMKDK